MLQKPGCQTETLSGGGLVEQAGELADEGGIKHGGRREKQLSFSAPSVFKRRSGSALVREPADARDAVGGEGQAGG